jgi:ATP-dependent Clp protease ATP-binding subunit ClpA
MNISIRISEEAKMWFSSKGFSSSYGARPLRRIIQKEIEDRLATMFLKKELKSGDEVVITAIDDRLNFNIEHQDVDKLVETSILT